jgi:hypothetical protein
MKIDDSKTIADVQSEFRSKFEGLKIEFYKEKHDPHKGSPLAQQWPSSNKLKDIRTNHSKGNIVLSPEMTVSQLEYVFEDNFGLHVQVFRKSNNLWLQTSVTDEWTLEKQNLKGIHSIQE